ncbi:vicilin-like seed storage protein At2g18540 [Sipha flava]|uniref:Vicilin-like seed storage protein At2g18540 n=1 Tax=Sipha flava TaxID=143950 RepID=A0A8B8G9S6_9HEMI|nr:vicilin-like seed storage protein At2g18540 [Sipha flava]
MEIVYVGDRNSKNRALLISNEEWKRLGKILTKKLDEVDAIDASKRLKEKRREISKKMVEGWDNTKLNKTKKLLEQKRKALSELEAQRQQRDKEMKHEAIETRNKIIEKAKKQKFEERDAVKAFNRALQNSEVFKERAIQINFNKSERKKRIDNDLMIAQKQNREAEQYIRDQINEKDKNKQIKKDSAKILLKELKDREKKRHEEELTLHKLGKEKLQEIAREIEEIRNKNIVDVQIAKEKLQKDIEDNRELISINNKMKQIEEDEEEMVTAIMAETKKILARKRIQKEIELTEVKQLALEEMRMRVAALPMKDKGWAESDVRSAIEKQEQRYQNGRLEKKEIAKKKIEHDQSGKKLWEEEISRRREQLFQDSGREMERRERERRLLVEYGELHKFTQIKNANEIRKNLDKQCNDKKLALMADRQADINRYKAFEQQWHEEDKEFLAYTENMIELKKQAGNPTVPLLKTVNNYLKTNNLKMDSNNKVIKKEPKGPIYTSRIIHQTN